MRTAVRKNELMQQSIISASTNRSDNGIGITGTQTIEISFFLCFFVSFTLLFIHSLSFARSPICSSIHKCVHLIHEGHWWGLIGRTQPPWPRRRHFSWLQFAMKDNFFLSFFHSFFLSFVFLPYYIEIGPLVSDKKCFVWLSWPA